MLSAESREVLLEVLGEERSERGEWEPGGPMAIVEGR
jgi:hypothetical protein